MNEKTKESPSLRVISREIAPDYSERRYLSRFSVASEQFRLIPQGKIFSLSDLTEKGMGFWLLDVEDQAMFTVGQSLEGVLNLRRLKYQVKARVKNLGKDRIGCEFENLSSDTTQALSLFLSPALLASELKPVPSPQKNTMWYHGHTGTDVLLVQDASGSFKKFILYVLGCCIQWEQEGGLSTGKFTASFFDGCEIQGVFRMEPLIVEPDSVADPEKLSIAKTVLLGSNLPQELKMWCLGCLGL
jgi:hypothetical protein